MRFAGLIKSSLVDYPGLVSCVLFMPFCNINCFYCHNRPLVEGTLPLLDERELTAFLKKRAGLLDGVVLTGGEPTLHEGLEEYIEWLKALGYKVKLDTNGTDPQTIRRFLSHRLCDYYAVDYKAPAARYEEICGVGADAHKVLETIRLLAAQDATFEVRTTVIPQLSIADLSQMARELPPLPRYVLNRYRVPEQYAAHERERILQKPYTQGEINAFAKALQELQPNTIS
ncbi:MAG: anaerobic ribonucleoside-triphosphate reductase activating protein [Acetanaerobacterium sp.]